VPTFASAAEAAAFWDAHDISEFADELDPVEIEFAQPLSEAVTLRLDRETMEEVRAIAATHGYPPDVLLQIWILERRDAERRRGNGT
jgi:hypothetical protein